MPETLYKTDKPMESISECYTMSVSSVPGTSQYEFTEKHGWWDEKSKRFIHAYTTLNPEEGMTINEAHEMYERQRARRAREGFVHSFAPDYYSNAEYEYRNIEFKVGRFKLVLQAAADVRQGPAYRAVAIDIADDENTVEALLSPEMVRSLLMFTFGGETTIVDVYLERLVDQQVVELDATPKDPAIFTTDELIRFGFSPDDLTDPANRESE